MRRLALLGVFWVAVCAAQAQMKMSVKQLVQFIRSSIELKHDDKKVAAYVKRIALTEQLDARTVEDLIGQGAGGRTIEALNALLESSKALPVARKEAPKPPPPAIPPPSEADQRRVLEETRQYALSYTKNLPNFICTQVTRRYADPSGLEFFAQQDTLTTKLTFFEQKEDYKVILVNNRPTDVAYDQVGGSISAGEFGTMLREIFEPESEADFRWARWTTLRGRRTHVYDYSVPQPRSKWRITYEKSLEVIAGYKGQVYVDAQDGSVTRIRLEAQNLPASFPVQQASVELDYDIVPIADQSFMLPLRHTMRMRSGKLLVKNDVEFRMYRRFGADTTITFDTPEALSEEKFTEKPPQ